MPKQNVRRGRIAKIRRQEQAISGSEVPNQIWDAEKRVWVKS